ncbi:MAG: hypothetical protein WC379_09130 [Methanoregula sp.]|jgi:hypothetical protein
MLERFFEKEANGVLKGMTLEWLCPHCSGKNFRILSRGERDSGEYHTSCRYCRARCRVTFIPPAPLNGEEEFMDRLANEDFSEEEQQDLIRDFAEIEYMRSENPGNREITGKQRLLEEKIAFFKRRRRL